MVTFAAADPVSPEFRRAIGVRIAEFIEGQRPVLAGIGPEVSELADQAAAFTEGGKRLRPAFCAWGHVAAAGLPADTGALLEAAASLDLLHVSALVHDDVMDASDTRRGRPSAHRQFEALHRRVDWRGSADDFGRAAAILLGDLLLVWSVEMFRRSGLPDAALDQAMPLVESVRTEVTAGQYLDIVAQARSPLDARRHPTAMLDAVNRVVEFKTARYTVVRPLQIGAALGGADQPLLSALQAYGSPLGRAFQFRDDLLGVFGDAQVTGKPAGDDLREGKLTVLIAHAMAGTTDAGAARLAGLLGRPELSSVEVDAARQIIDDSGARTSTEKSIGVAAEQALSALDDAAVTDEGRVALTRLVQLAVDRDS